MRSLPQRIAAVLTIVSTAALVSVRADKPPVEIAAILSISGPYAQVGFMEARALYTAVQVANAQGGISGREVTLHLFDDHSDAGRAFTLADSVVRAKTAAAIIGGSVTPTCDAIRLATEPSHVVQYCLSGGQGSGDTYFSSFPAPSQLFGTLPAEFMSEHHLKRVAAIVPNNHAGAVYESALRPALIAQERELISVAHTDAAEDAVSAVDHAMKERADVIYLGGPRATEAAVLHEMRKHRSRTTVWLVDSAAGSEEANAFAGFLPRGPVYTAGDAIAVGAQLPPSNIQRPRLISYWKTFQQYNSGLAPNTYAAITADAAEFIISGLRADGGIGGQPLATVIENTPPTLGLYSTYHFSPERHAAANVPGTIIRLIPNGSLKYVEQLSPGEISEEPPVEAPATPAVEAPAPPAVEAPAPQASAAPATLDTPAPADQTPAQPPAGAATAPASDGQPDPAAPRSRVPDSPDAPGVATPLPSENDAAQPADAVASPSAPAAAASPESASPDTSAVPQAETATPVPAVAPPGGTDEDDGSTMRVTPQTGSSGGTSSI